MEDAYVPTPLICCVFAANGVCYREVIMGTCPYKHDWFAWAAVWEMKKQKALHIGPGPAETASFILEPAEIRDCSEKQVVECQSSHGHQTKTKTKEVSNVSNVSPPLTDAKSFHGHSNHSKTTTKKASTVSPPLTDAVSSHGHSNHSKTKAKKISNVSPPLTNAYLREPVLAVQLPDIPYSKDLPILSITKGPRPPIKLSAEKPQSMTVTEHRARKGWDSMPCTWESWGRGVYIEADYNKFIAPWIHQLEMDIISKEFLEQDGASNTKLLPMAAMTFHQFRTLPAELRIKIWGFAFQGDENTLRLGFHYDLGNTTAYSARIINGRSVALSGTPSYFAVSHESRELARSSGCWKPMFRLKINARASTPGGIFSPKKDRLFLQTSDVQAWPWMVNAISPVQRAQIERLCIPYQHLIMGNETMIGEQIARNFPNLNSLTLIASDAVTEHGVSRKAQPWYKMENWWMNLWARVWKNSNLARASAAPTLLLEKIPAHKAHHWKIDSHATFTNALLTLY